MDTISIFLRDLRGCPRYTKEEESALAGRFATADEALEAREQLILSCAPFAVALSKRCWGRGLPHEDLMQFAMLGLIDAVDRFDPSRGRLTTCVEVHVRKHILLGIAKSSSVIRVPVNEFWGHGPHQAEADRVRGGIISIDSGDLDLEEESSLLSDDTAAAVAEEEIWLHECRELLEPAMGSLSDRERQIVRCRLSGMTLREVGTQIGLSRERVRQIMTVALDKIRMSA
jgi:RNA polymerase primary sigma factor